MQPQASAAGLMPLEDLYLNTLALLAEGEKLSCIVQQISEGNGRLWLAPHGSTVPQAQIAFKFDLNGVHLGVLHRDERELVREIRYAEGLDAFLIELRRFMRAGRIADKRGAA
jgi:hypothetical protein